MVKKQLKVIACFTIFLLFVNSALLAAPYHIITIDSDGFQRILVCTSQGYQWITISVGDSPDINASAYITDNPYQDLTQPSPSTKNHDCPFCIFNAYGIDEAIDNPFLLLSLNPCDVKLFLREYHYIDSYHVLSLSTKASRAPPYTA